jgi:hypothetical protein
VGRVGVRRRVPCLCHDHGAPTSERPSPTAAARRPTSGGERARCGSPPPAGPSGLRPTERARTGDGQLTNPIYRTDDLGAAPSDPDGCGRSKRLAGVTFCRAEVRVKPTPLFVNSTDSLVVGGCARPGPGAPTALTRKPPKGGLPEGRSRPRSRTRPRLAGLTAGPTGHAAQCSAAMGPALPTERRDRERRRSRCCCSKGGGRSRASPGHPRF